MLFAFTFQTVQFEGILPLFLFFFFYRVEVKFGSLDFGGQYLIKDSFLNLLENSIWLLFNLLIINSQDFFLNLLYVDNDF